MGKSKQKHRSTREYQISANSRAARKRDKQDVVHRMVMTSLESKTRGDVYGNVKKIHDAIFIRPWTTEDIIRRAPRRKKLKISNNKLLDKEEAEADKNEHQISVLSLISSTTINGGRPKGPTLKNKKNIQERMDEVKTHITHLSLEEKNKFHRLPTGTLHLLYKYIMTKYDPH